MSRFCNRPVSQWPCQPTQVPASEPMATEPVAPILVVTVLAEAGRPVLARVEVEASAEDHFFRRLVSRSVRTNNRRLVWMAPASTSLRPTARPSRQNDGAIDAPPGRDRARHARRSVRRAWGRPEGSSPCNRSEKARYDPHAPRSTTSTQRIRRTDLQSLHPRQFDPPLPPKAREYQDFRVWPERLNIFRPLLA